VKNRIDIIAKVTHAFIATIEGNILPIKKTRALHEFVFFNSTKAPITAEAIILRNGYGHWGLQILPVTICQPGNRIIFGKVQFGVRDP
jgi:hypothetical protein